MTEKFLYLCWHFIMLLAQKDECFLLKKHAKCQQN